jgi:hypothetical protein
MSAMDIHVFAIGLYRSPVFIRVEPLKPPLEPSRRISCTTYVRRVNIQSINVLMIGNDTHA